MCRKYTTFFSINQIICKLILHVFLIHQHTSHPCHILLGLLDDLIDMNKHINVLLLQDDEKLKNIETNVILTTDHLDDHQVTLQNGKQKTWWENKIAMVLASCSVVLTTVLVVVFI